MIQIVGSLNQTLLNGSHLVKLYRIASTSLVYSRLAKTLLKNFGGQVQSRRT